MCFCTSRASSTCGSTPLRPYGFGEAETEGAALVCGAVTGLTAGAGVVGIGFVTVPGGPTAEEGPGLAVGEVTAGAGVAETAAVGVCPFMISW
ncbi:MAG: hypothetical protein QOD12_2932 [Verrucomicrobiota bacterium]